MDDEHDPSVQHRRGSSDPAAAALKEEILHAIVSEMREPHPDLDRVRFDPKYEKVIGRKAGSAGRQRWLRWSGKITKPCPLDKTRPHEQRQIRQDQAAWAFRAATGLGAHDRIPPPSPEEVMQKGTGAAAAAKNVPAGLAEARRAASLLRSAALAPDLQQPGGYRVLHSDLLIKAARLDLDADRAAREHERHEAERRQDQTFSTAIVGAVDRVLREHPGLRRELIQEILQLTGAEA